MGNDCSNHKVPRVNIIKYNQGIATIRFRNVMGGSPQQPQGSTSPDLKFAINPSHNKYKIPQSGDKNVPNDKSTPGNFELPST